MKFTANTVELQRTLSKLGGVIQTKSTMPILETILVELVKDMLTLTATDMALSLTVTMSVDGMEDGKVAIPAKRFVDTIRSLPDTSAKFNIDTGTNKIKITTEFGEYSLTGESAKDFPVVPPFRGTEEVRLDNVTLRKIIHKTVFAVSVDELRPAMMGVLLQAHGGELRAVSTDGHRLVKFQYKCDPPVALQKDIVIPAKALIVLSKSLDEGECAISVGETHIRFSFDKSFLVSRLIDETYPNYESVIPTDNTKAMTVNREEMISSIRRVALYASATTHQVRFDIGSSALHITAQDIDFGGDAKEKIKCNFSDGTMEIGFNSTYLIDILTHLDGENVTFRFSTPTRAGLISPADQSEREAVIMLVMPVRLNS
jgi:DNA polymerase III subunit beta